MVGKGPGRRLIVIRSAVTTQLSAQRLVGLKAELDGLLALAGYDAEKDQVVLVGDLLLTGNHCVPIVKWACGAASVAAVRPENSAAVLGSVRAWQKMQKDGSPPPPCFQYVRKFAPDEAEWLAALPFVMTVPELQVTITGGGLLEGPRNEALMSNHGEALVALVLPARHKGKAGLAEVLRYQTTEAQCTFGTGLQCGMAPPRAELVQTWFAEEPDGEEREDAALKGRALDTDITTSSRRRTTRLEGKRRGDLSTPEQQERLQESRARYRDLMANRRKFDADVASP